MSQAEMLTRDQALLRYDLDAMIPQYFDPAQIKQYLVAISSQSDSTNESISTMPPIAFATSKCLIIMNSINKLVQGGVHPMVNADSIFEDVAKLMLLSVNEMADTVLGAPVMTPAVTFGGPRYV